MIKHVLLAMSFTAIAVVPGHADEPVTDDGLAVQQERIAAEIANLPDTVGRDVFTEDMIEPRMREAMKRAIAEYHGWDGYEVSEK